MNAGRIPTGHLGKNYSHDGWYRLIKKEQENCLETLEFKDYQKRKIRIT